MGRNLALADDVSLAGLRGVRSVGAGIGRSRAAREFMRAGDRVPARLPATGRRDGRDRRAEEGFVLTVCPTSGLPESAGEATASTGSVETGNGSAAGCSVTGWTSAGAEDAAGSNALTNA
jgi:hypothetical protein